MAGGLAGALFFADPASAGPAMASEAMDFTGAYAGFNLGYGFRTGGEPPPATSGAGGAAIPDPSLPPSAASAAGRLRDGREAGRAPARR